MTRCRHCERCLHVTTQVRHLGSGMESDNESYTVTAKCNTKTTHAFFLWCKLQEYLIVRWGPNTDKKQFFYTMRQTCRLVPRFLQRQRHNNNVISAKKLYRIFVSVQPSALTFKKKSLSSFPLWLLVSALDAAVHAVKAGAFKRAKKRAKMGRNLMICPAIDKVISSSLFSLPHSSSLGSRLTGR